MRPRRPQATTHSRTSEPPFGCCAHWACGFAGLYAATRLYPKREVGRNCHETGQPRRPATHAVALHFGADEYRFLDLRNPMVDADTSKTHRLHRVFSIGVVSDSFFPLRDLEVFAGGE